VSEYIDYSSFPAKHSERYKISAVDSFGNETDMSPYHQQIKLQVVQGLPATTTSLDWEIYEDESGNFVPGKYYIFRGTDPYNLTLHDSTSAAVTLYDDLNVTQEYHYFVAIKKYCDPYHYFKSSGGPYSQSISNIEDNRLKGSNIQSISDNISIAVIPNPYKDIATISYKVNIPGMVQINVYTACGVLIDELVNERQTPGSYALQYHAHKSGAYYLHVAFNGNNKVIKIIQLND
jgi:hypothetical protein